MPDDTLVFLVDSRKITRTIDKADNREIKGIAKANKTCRFIRSINVETSRQDHRLVWAPHAQRVAVIGSFSGWDSDKHLMQAEESGYWYTNVAQAHVGDQYKFLLTTAQGEFKRIDPYAREVTNSVGNAIVHDPGFDWRGG